MTTFTSSLPDNLLKKLSDAAQQYGLAKNKIIEKALNIYLDELKRARYIKSYQKAANDEEILMMAEEGVADYFKQLNELDKK